MDEKEKMEVIKDMDTFLTFAEWYEEHGVPLRRGYLFCGPPGTGKTKATTAFAQYFGLDIYIIPLADKAMDDSFLQRLFDELPNRASSCSKTSMQQALVCLELALKKTKPELEAKSPQKTR
jgi:DNA polymerase III delta prime subunit